jgi:DNA-binding transcriptional regulator YiaG
MKDIDLKTVRKDLELSQEDFGHLLGVTGATVHRWEKGVYKPSKLAIEKINQLLDQKGLR